MNEALILSQIYGRDDNTARPHSSLGYRPPAPKAFELKMAVGLT